MEGRPTSTTPLLRNGRVKTNCNKPPLRQHRYKPYRILVDILFGCLLWTVTGVFKWGTTAYKRGFLCNDDSLFYSFSGETINTTQMMTFCYLVPPALILLNELYILYFDNDFCYFKSQRELPIACAFVGSKWVLQFTSRLYFYVGYFMLGGGIANALSEMTKTSLGELRPIFMLLCRPANYSAIMERCRLSPGVIEDYTCLNPPEIAKEGHLSFPSGHAVNVFYAMLFLVFYLEERSRSDWLRMSRGFRHSLQTVFMGLALYTCISRVQDNVHHPRDVIGGAILGSLVFLAIGSKTFSSKFMFQSCQVVEPSCNDESLPKHSSTQSLLAAKVTAVSPRADELKNRKSYEDIND